MINRGDVPVTWEEVVTLARAVGEASANDEPVCIDAPSAIDEQIALLADLVTAFDAYAVKWAAASSDETDASTLHCGSGVFRTSRTNGQAGEQKTKRVHPPGSKAG